MYKKSFIHDLKAITVAIRVEFNVLDVDLNLLTVDLHAAPQKNSKCFKMGFLRAPPKGSPRSR